MYGVIGIFSYSGRIETAVAESKAQACALGREMVAKSASNILIIDIDGNVLGLDNVCAPDEEADA